MTNGPDWRSRTQLLLGGDKTDLLAAKHVLAVGTGGVGAAAVELLVRAGVGELTVADGDTVETTNRNRQLPALVSTLGRPKIEVMAERLKDINPELRLHTVNRFLTETDMDELLAGTAFDLVLDAIDTVAPKTALLAGAVRRGIPVVSSMGAGARLDPEKVRCADISKTSVCGLARAVRLNLRKQNITHGVTAVFSTETPVRGSIVPDPDAESGKKSVTGTVSYMPMVFGCHCAAAAVRLLCGF